jgi:hypothetical protein
MWDRARSYTRIQLCLVRAAAARSYLPATPATPALSEAAR